MYNKTASEAGLANQSQRGWRKALYCGLSDGTNIKLEVKKKPKTITKNSQIPGSLSLFDLIEKGDLRCH